MPPGALTFTLDLEDHRPSDAAPQRYPMLVRRLLGLSLRLQSSSEQVAP